MSTQVYLFKTGSAEQLSKRLRDRARSQKKTSTNNSVNNDDINLKLLFPNTFC